ncbi:glycosyltransferase family 2 protein [bacterium]|nr:glycosyltransferase family 2 protein [bacterium]
MTRNIKEFVNQNAEPGCIPAHFSQDHVCVLLALHNGARMLADQLNSLAAQSHRDWSLIISDDGSSDDWLGIATAFAETRAKGRTWLISGPQKGFAQNFLSLSKAAGPFVPYVAFCDQDDVWMQAKLARAVARLQSLPAGRPALYCSRTMVCDSTLRAQRPSPLFRRPAGFSNALVQNIGGGNTMVMNRAALDLVQDTLRHATGIASHDWWVYQLVSGAGGLVIYDTEPSVLYRQHGENLIGANNSYLASAARLKGLLEGRFQIWNDANIAALTRARHWLTPEARRRLEWFAAARQGSLRHRFKALFRSGVYRQTLRGTVALWLAALTNRL